MSAESLTVVDNRTGVEYTLPIVDGAIHATGLGQIKDADGAGLLSYDPAFLNTASCRSAITYIDGDAGILRYRGYPIEQVAERAGFLETAYLLFEGELPTDEPAAEVDRRRAAAHLRAHEHRGVHGRLPLRRASDGDAARRRRRTLDLLPRREAHLRSREPIPPAGAVGREAADDRRVHLPPQPRSPLRAAAQRPRLRRQLRQHDVRDRRPARAEPGAAAGARDPPHPPRRPRAELLDERRPRRRLVERRSVLGRLRRDRRALRAAARRRERGGAADARRDRRRRERAGVRRGGQGRAAPARG